MSGAAEERPPERKSEALKDAKGRWVYDTRELIGAAREAILWHRGEPYRLRVTASNKLILTK